MTGEEKANELEQQLLKMGFELRRLALFETECNRKDGEIVSLRNEIADLRSILSKKEDEFRRFGLDYKYSGESIYSQHDSDMLKNVIQEKDDLKRHSAHKLALLQSQLNQKNKEIKDLEERLDEVLAGKSSRQYPDASTDVIASLKSTLARKDLQIAQLQTDLEKSNKQKTQSASLVITLQREISTKDALVQKSNNEVDRLKRDNREKESQIALLSAKITKQRASKEVEKDFRRKEEELGSFRQKLLNADHQIQDKITTIHKMENEIENLRRIIDEGKQNDVHMQKELQNMRIQYVEKERADKSNRIELKEMQIKRDTFMNELSRIVYASGLVKPDKDIHEEDFIKIIEKVIDERTSLKLRADELYGYEKELKHYAKEDEHYRHGLEKFLTSMEKRLIRNGRLCESLDDEIRSIHDLDLTGSLSWIKDVIIGILEQERNWEQSIEDALLDAGMEVDRGKKEPPHLIRKMKERIMKKKEKIVNLKARLKAVGGEHEESLKNFKTKFLQDTEEEVTKAVEKLKRDEEKKIQDLSHEFLKREKQKIAEAIETERKIFEREFGNLTELHKQLGQTQLAIDQHKSKSLTLEDQVLQLKFAMEKAQQNENELRREIEELHVNHKVQLEAVNQDKEEVKQKCLEEINVYREQAHQYSLTIVALEDKLLKLSKSRKKTDDDLTYMKQYRDSFSLTGKTSPRPKSPKRMISRPTSPRKVYKRDAANLTDISLLEQDVRRKEEIERLEQLVIALRKEAGDARRQTNEQSEVVRGLRRDLAGASARLSDITGELDDTQKQKIEELQTRIVKQDEELFVQRKQLTELSALLEKQKKELLKRDDKLKEQIFVTKEQEKKLKEKGKEIVQLIRTHEDKEDEGDAEKLEIAKQAFASQEVVAAGARCLGDKHDQTILRQREAIAEMRQRIKDLEQFQPPYPSQQAALQQVGIMKRELAELRSELAIREQDMYKDETQLQSETRVSRELLNSVNQELAIEKLAHNETRDALDISERIYIDLMRAVCGLLDMEVPKKVGTIIHVPPKEKEKLINGRNNILETIIKRLDALQKRLGRKEKLLGGYEKDLTQLRDTEELAGRKSAETISLSTSLRSKQNEIDCLREALKRVREELDQQKRLNKSLSQRKVFKMDLEQQREKENRGHHCYEDDETKHKEEMKKRKQAEKLKRKSYEIESLKKELRSADLELSETAARLHEFQTNQSRLSPREEPIEETAEPAFEELWKHS
ncbi:forkhead-associated domain-containing protein 1-like [Rhopilema esculentum]|uniref:forkhead-associated domain-containing protein 1-like n=1 Tax=Rhopilema esculentum TaxID=499914 RepID=UPI0031E3D354